MNKEDFRIVFMGNPEFARLHLERLLSESFNVVAVISAPDKPAGRGMKINSTPVTVYAREKNIPVLQPSNLKSPEFQAELASFKADIQVVIAFRMLPEAVWDMPEMGTLNIHASLLPQYRGAAPINWAIINGEKESGVTSFRLKHEIDTGDILLQKRCEISETDTAGSLHDKLMYLGADTIVESLDGLISGDLKETPQLASDELKSAPKLFSSNSTIDWNAPTRKIFDFVRGLAPYPVAHTRMDNKRLKVYSCSLEQVNHDLPSGTFISDNKDYLKVACSDGFVFLNEIQLEGKRRMEIKDFLRGYNKDINSL